MSSVVVVMLVVVCTPDLLQCSEPDAWHHAWTSTEACELDKAWISRQIEPSQDRVTLTTCKLYLDEDGIYKSPPRDTHEDNRTVLKTRLIN